MNAKPECWSLGRLGVYLQIPFCASKCSYCNFTSGVARRAVIEKYCAALLEEIARLPIFYEALGLDVQLLQCPVDSVYLGGGTPSLIGVEGLRAVVERLRQRFRLCESVEFTLEVTPGSAERGSLEALRELGVNRLSVGAQTFDDRELRAAGRLHSGTETRELVRSARQAEFDNISLDFIAGLPYQTSASWRDTLRAAAELHPEHISVYLFEIDEKSRLGAEIIRHGERYHAAAVPDEAFVADAYEAAQGFLTDAGYVQYEISNFALPGCASRHNRKYWQLAPYFGLGAGAHSFDGEHRWSNTALPEAYAQAVARGDSPVADFRMLSPEEQLEEFFFLGLRQVEGVDLKAARCRWSAMRLMPWERTIRALAEQGLVECQGERVRLTRRAYLVSNEVFQEFLAPAG